MVKVYLFPADEGDFIWVRYGNDENYANILIDGGTKDSGAEYAEVIQFIAEYGETIEALILTHIDYDHIQGVVDGISRVSSNILKKVVKRILFNTCRAISLEQGQAIDENKYVENQIIGNAYMGAYGIGDAIALMDLLKEKDVADRVMDYIVSGMEMIWDKNAFIRIISPGKKELNQFLNKWEPYCRETDVSAYTANLESTRENLVDLMEERLGSDSSINNAASIAFLFEYDYVRIAFLADAKPSVCIQGLKELKIKLPYQVDVLKLSHHGSKSNTSDALLKKLKTEIYALSTNGNGQRVPNKAVVAHLLKNAPEHNGFFLNFGYNSIAIKPSDKCSDGLTYIRSIRVKSLVLIKKASLHFLVRLTILDLPYTIRLMSLNLLLFPSTNPELTSMDIAFLTEAISFFKLLQKDDSFVSAYFSKYLSIFSGSSPISIS